MRPRKCRLARFNSRPVHENNRKAYSTIVITESNEDIMLHSVGPNFFGHRFKFAFSMGSFLRLYRCLLWRYLFPTHCALSTSLYPWVQTIPYWRYITPYMSLLPWDLMGHGHRLVMLPVRVRTLFPERRLLCTMMSVALLLSEGLRLAPPVYG